METFEKAGLNKLAMFVLLTYSPQGDGNMDNYIAGAISSKSLTYLFPARGWKPNVGGHLATSETGLTYLFPARGWKHYQSCLATSAGNVG